MEFSIEQLETIEYLGNQLRDSVAIARILCVDALEFDVELKTKNTPAGNAYWRGREMRITALHKATLDAAVEGSTPAIEKALEILKNLI
jgi:hypothetical protein